MSVRVLSMVWEGYPGGGSHLLVMLALADWSDDAGRCWPSIAAIGRKARLSPDQARRVTHRLIESGVLQVTGSKDGGGASRRYQIQLDKLTPCADATPSANARGGADASPPLAPMQVDPLHNYASRTVIDTSLNRQEVAQALPVPPIKLKAKKTDITLQAFLEQCEATGAEAIPADAPVFAYAEKVGISRDMLNVAWQEFKGYWKTGDGKAKRKSDWPGTFYNSVKQNRGKLWYVKDGEAAQWTTVGEQARRVAA